MHPARAPYGCRRPLGCARWPSRPSSPGSARGALDEHLVPGLGPGWRLRSRGRPPTPWAQPTPPWPLPTPRRVLCGRLSSRPPPLGGWGRVQCYGGANERLQCRFIDLVALMEIDGTPGVAFEAGVEEP